jgi:protein-S-isoprenylcysteine O-methyltransferase Ste14
MWIVRFILLGLFIAQVGVGSIFLSHRKKYEKLFENGLVNLAIVIVYLLFCILLAGLPSDPEVFTPPVFFVGPEARIGYAIIGLILIGLSVFFWVTVVRQRKVLGGQDVKEGLLTSGLYQYFRHPIYAAIIWMSLGLALALGSWDGVLMFPAISLVNAAEAFFEERYDVGARFSSQYREYRKQTRMFGPLWVWASLAGVLAAVPLVVYLR